MSTKDNASTAFHTVGAYYDRGNNDTALPRRVQFMGLKAAECEFRAAAASETMPAGETFTMSRTDAREYYKAPSQNQGRGVIFA